MTQNSGTKDNQPELDLSSVLVPSYVDHELTCFQCEKVVNYLFDDCRCGECTRMTPEEVHGGY
jgi:hypothetical protein